MSVKLFSIDGKNETTLEMIIECGDLNDEEIFIVQNMKVDETVEIGWASEIKRTK